MTPAELVRLADKQHGVAAYGDYWVWRTPFVRRDGSERTKTAWRWRSIPMRMQDLPLELDYPPRWAKVAEPWKQRSHGGRRRAEG